MSLRETALLAVIVLTGVPVLASYFRHRFSASWVFTLLAALCLTAFLGILWRLVYLGAHPGGHPWAVAALAMGVPVLVTGYLFSGTLGRENAGLAVRGMNRGLSILLGLGVLALIFVRDPAFLAEYHWRAGTGTLVLGPLGKAYLSFLLVGAVFVGQNLERAFRLARTPETSRLQPVVLGFFGVLGFLAYVLTTGVVYGEVDVDNLVALAVPLTVANVVMGYGLLRGSLVDTTAPVSRDVVYSSFTVTVAVLYFVAMGAAAQLATLTGWAPGHVVTASFVFLVLIVASVVLFSSRFKQGVRRFIDRNFYVHRHDYRSHWARLTRDLDPSDGLGRVLAASESFLRDAFDADAVSIALTDTVRPGMRVRQGRGADSPDAYLPPDATLSALLQSEGRSVLLDGPEALRSTVVLAAENPGWFRHAAAQIVTPLRVGDDLLGIVGLERHRTGDPFTTEDGELLDYAAAQVAAVIRGALWGRDLADAREVELLSNWSNMLLHDLKNYLSPLQMIVQNMRRHQANPEFLRDAMEDVANVTGRMEGLMKRLSDLRKGSFSYQHLDLGELVQECLDALKVADAPVTLHVELAPGTEVRGDAAMLRRVAENLITNALQAMKEPGTLTVSVQRREGREGPEVELAVTDTGAGMEEAFIRDHLFHPFATTKRKGLGLGLYQCRRIVEAHGGDIVVESAPGEGACFRILLPAVIPLESAGRDDAVPAVAR